MGAATILSRDSDRTLLAKQEGAYNMNTTRGCVASIITACRLVPCIVFRCRSEMPCRWLALGLLISTAASLGDEVPESNSATPPNIVFVLADDLGWRDLGCYGSTLHETPNLDRLAQRGIRFTNAYAAAPACSPTRATILTGQNPVRTGMTGLAGYRGRSAPASVPLLPLDSAKRLPQAHRLPAVSGDRLLARPSRGQ